MGFFTKRGGNLADYFAKSFPPSEGFADACMEMVELMRDGTVEKNAPLCKARSNSTGAQTRYVTGEATATYLAMADPTAVARALPAVRLLVVLRCPVRRAASHHAMHARFQAEGRSAYKNLKSLKKSFNDELDRVELGKPPRRAGLPKQLCTTFY